MLGLLSAPFLLGGGGGAAKGLLPCFLVPKGDQPTACTLALWWLKFGPTRGGGGGGASQVGDGLTVSELREVVGRAVSESVSEVVPEDTQDAMSALVGLPDRPERIVKEAAKGKASKVEADLAAMRQVTAQQKGRIVELEAQVRTLH